MSSIEDKVRRIMDLLAREHGDEAFVSDGYGYYDDAVDKFTSIITLIRKDTIEMCRTPACPRHMEQFFTRMKSCVVDDDNCLFCEAVETEKDE